MTNRGRWLPTYMPKGEYGRFGQIDATNTYYLSEGHWCADTIAPGDNWDFVVSHVREHEVSGGRIWQGERGQWNPAWADGHKLQHFNDIDLAFPARWGPFDDRGDGAYATETAARSNPSRPYVDIPVNILELGDIAQLVQNSGKALLDPIRRIARNNIRNQFGILPVMTDLMKLVNFTEQAHRRVQEIEKLRKSKTGLRRTVTLVDSIETGDYWKIFHQTSDFYVAGVQHEAHRFVIKGHARWIPSYDLSHLTDEEMMGLAKKSVLGLTLDFATLWEAMPWSWLIDYCTKMGDFLKAYRNIVPATLESVSISRSIHATYWFEGENLGWRSVTPFTVERNFGRRTPMIVTPTAHFPFLSESQMGILASLAVLRAK